jgi:hypothetical protein
VGDELLDPAGWDPDVTPDADEPNSSLDDAALYESQPDVQGFRSLGLG